jgi:hypothetical protein
MLRLGFSDQWVQMIMRCVRSVRFSVKLNGALSECRGNLETVAMGRLIGGARRW